MAGEGVKPEAPPAAPAAAAPAAPKYKCSHCFDTGKIQHKGEVACPWCSGGTARKGSK